MRKKSVQNDFTHECLRLNYFNFILRGIIEVNKRKCFNCSVTQTKRWYNLLKVHNLCKLCGDYRQKFGRFRSNKLWVRATKRNTQHRTCFICGITKTSHWYRDSMSENDLCYKCYLKQYRTRTKTTKHLKNN
uniref:GATA-type domain-containing protein n=1 Tax=Meloidogyne enterolobii TaxID=390850 RepID=A0A6V7XKA3_MELEN|nr:unnamed protein product [Meloidogyne enterolobii]